MEFLKAVYLITYNQYKISQHFYSKLFFKYIEKTSIACLWHFKISYVY